MSSAAPKPSPEEILENALKLPKDQRLRLAQQLRDSVEHDTDVEAAWGDEIADRLEAFERGDVETVSARDLFQRLRAKHARG